MASAVQPHDIRTIFSFARHNRKAELEAFLISFGFDSCLRDKIFEKIFGILS